MTSMSLQASFQPESGTTPTSRISPYEGTAGIPVLKLSPLYDRNVFEVSFDPRNPSESIRYLRELVAASLAADIEAVLQS